MHVVYCGFARANGAVLAEEHVCSLLSCRSGHCSACAVQAIPQNLIVYPQRNVEQIQLVCREAAQEHNAKDVSAVIVVCMSAKHCAEVVQVRGQGRGHNVQDIMFETSRVHATYINGVAAMMQYTSV